MFVAMADESLKIERGGDRCSACAAALVPEAPGYSGLHRREGGEPGFIRRDYCPRCFEALPKEARPISFWRRAPLPKRDPAGKETAAAKRKRDLEALSELFARLSEAPAPVPAPVAVAEASAGAGAGATSTSTSGTGTGTGSPEDRDKLRYILALALVRRKRLDLVEVARDGGADVLILRSSGKADLISIPAPSISRDELERLGRDLETEVGR
jgi:hypothetical protein